MYKPKTFCVKALFSPCIYVTAPIHISGSFTNFFLQIQTIIEIFGNVHERSRLVKCKTKYL